jgi:hypothetical protein
MKTFKFFGKLKDYTVNIQHVSMFKVYTYNEVTQSDIDKWTKLIEPFILLPNTEDNRIEMMELLSPYFFKIEMLYNENEVV